MAESLLQKAERLGIKPSTSPQESLVDKAQRLGIKPKSTQENINEPNYFQRVASSFTEAGKNISREVERGASAIQAGQTGEMLTVPQAISGASKLVETGLRTAGQVAISAFTPIVEAPIIKPLLEKIGQKITGYTPVKSIITGATELAKKYPETAKDIEAIINIATLGTGKAASAPLKAEAKAVGKDIISGTKSLLTPSEEVVQSNVQRLFQKSIKPTAKKTLAQGEKYQNDTLNALKTIKNNVDSLNIIDETGEIITGRTPKNINELAQAVDQTKKTVFSQYDELAKKAGTAGAIIDAKPLAVEVAKVAQNRALQITNPEVVKYAEDWAKRLQDLDVLDTETTQAVIQNLNNNLQAFYKNPTYESASKAAIDAGVVNNFRKALDTAIEGATGQQYQILKNQYGALKAIENDVVRASMRDARKNVKGLLDYSDIFTSGQIVAGALSLNPAMFTKGAIERGFKEYIKFLNDPNKAIENIFEQLGKKTSSESFTPQSATGKFIQNPKIGMSVERVGKDYAVDAPLSKIPQSTINKIPSSIRQEAKDTYEIALKLDTGKNFEAGSVRADYMRAFQKGEVTTDDIRTMQETHFMLKGNKEIMQSNYGNQLPTGLKTQQKVVNTSSKTLPQSDINASLLQEAPKYKSAEEFVKAQTNISEYRSAHQLNLSDSITADKIDIPKTKEKIRELNGYLNNETISDLRKLEKIQNNPDADITIYRASPKNELNDGDWVTTNKVYANNIKQQNGGKVFSYTVKARDLRYANDIESLPSMARASAFSYSPKTSKLIDIWNKANKK